MTRASIIVPAYNVAATLPETLGSLLNQSARDMEIVIVDDGSQDDTPAIAARLARQHSRLRGRADPVAAMKEIDAVAMPSRWEAFGQVALEARAAGRLLLAAPVDGLKDHIADGALAVGGQGVDDWTAALDRLGATEGSLRQLQSRRVAAGAGDRFARGWGTLLAGPERGEKSVQAA